MNSQIESRLLGFDNKSDFRFSTAGKCRVCLEIAKIPIFGKVSIAKEIMQITGIDILESDNLPKYICNNCYTLLQSALLFRRTAQRTDLILKSNKDLADNAFTEENESVCSEMFSNVESGEPFVKCEYLEINEATEDSDIESDWKTVASQDNYDNSSVDQCKDKDYLVEYLDFEETDEELSESKKKITANNKCDNQISSSIEKLDPEKDVQNRITCEICNEVVSTEFYKVHIKLHRATYKQKVEKRNKKVECDICHKMINETYYKYHKKLVHGDEKEKAETVSECPFCKQTFSARNISVHIKRAHYKDYGDNGKIVNTDDHTYKQCPVCDKNVKEEKYKNHLINHGNSRKDYICDKCGNKCATRSALDTHRLTHGSELKYKCNFCPYRGLHLGLLRIHVRTHTKDYNYKCTLCPAKFITKSNLSIHIQRHTGVGKYKCEHCGKTFYLKRNKENHIKAVHSTERNHKCDMCGAMFPHRDGMLSHQIKVHKRGKLANYIGRLPTYLKNELKKPEE
ncbi:hypothetical protein K1T71_013542 [Dendrolimus kikuchii]|uniref:Uncharacterized protein n=1 Tax=Dendrolimus kikuchii TaxID=765133 RepID=A0ACC1CGX7_9NEOP|nr:hypothetical protein K1T71_013542 [Dendrolimus kikuchii]